MASLTQPKPDTCLFFYGCTETPHGYLSNFHRCSIVMTPKDVDGVDAEYNKECSYNSAEQAIMHLKALMMGDTETAEKILLATTPLAAKRLGRKVKPWDETKWVQHRRGLARMVLLAKFEQNADLGGALTRTAPLHIAEASPRDKIWGIGIGVASAKKGELWKGANILGEALMSVRATLN